MESETKGFVFRKGFVDLGRCEPSNASWEEKPRRIHSEVGESKEVCKKVH